MSKFPIGRGVFLYKFEEKEFGAGGFNDSHFLSVNKAGHIMVCD